MHGIELPPWLKMGRHSERMSSCSGERAEGMLGVAAGGDDDMGLLELLLAIPARERERTKNREGEMDSNAC